MEKVEPKKDEYDQMVKNLTEEFYRACKRVERRRGRFRK